MESLYEAMKILLESKKESPWKIAPDLSEYKCETRSNEIEVGEEVLAADERWTSSSLPKLTLNLYRTMTRGDQRERDRERNRKKLAQQKKPKESAATLQARKEADAENLRKKQAAAEAKRAAGATSGGGK